MRTVMATVLVLLAAGYVATHAGPPATGGDRGTTAQSMASGIDDGWRRTVNGWEHRDQWARITPAQLSAPVPKTVHPMALAAAQLLAVVGLWLLTRWAGDRGRDEITQPIEAARDHSHPARATGV